jgi:glycosyltransferase involved in cell wall biosynthesis
MRVAHLTSAHPRDDIRIFHKECRSLVNAEYEVTLVVADGLGDAMRDGVQIIDVGCSSGRWDRIFRVTKRVRDRAIKLDRDVYHLHDPELLSVARALKKLGKKVIFDAHEDVPKQVLGKHYLHPVVRKLISYAVAVYERYVCARIDGIVAATPSIRDKFLRINSNTVDINNYPLVGELEGFMSWDAKADEVCYVGSIASIRGIKEVVASMALTQSGAKLNLVGGFVEPQVEVEVRADLGWRRVNALGVQNRQEVRNVLARSKVGLVTFHPLPNHVDAQPNKMFEYMSAGVPVIASNFPLWREIVNGNGCGECVDPMDPVAIAKAIDLIVSDPIRAKRMGENGRQAVEKKYNWAAEELKLKSFYRRLNAK